MSYNLERQRKESKKSCFMCGLSPQNILMLACDDSICLQCAYDVLKESSIKQYNNQQIEFRCKRCNQVTYLDKDLIKQIENSICPQKIKIHPLTQYHTKKNQRIDESFIEKMKKQYFSGQHKSLKQEFSYLQQMPNPSTNIYRKETEIQKQNKLQLTNQYLFDNKKDVQSQQKLSKQKISKVQQSLNKKNQFQQLQSTKCRTHCYYELIYYCVDCKQIVCSECLLRGRHKEHRNESITQILENDLPKFINETSQKLLSQVNQVQCIKESKYSELNRKISEINKIRHNAFQYFNQVKRNIEKQQNEVLHRCDQVLQNLRQQQKQIQTHQKDIEIQLVDYIRQIKELKSSYKQLIDYPHQKSNKLHQKSIIQKFILCSHSIQQFFREKNQKIDCRKESQNRYSNQINKGRINLNKKIQQSIESIRQSLVFDNYSQKFNNLINQQKNQQNQSQQSRLSLLKPFLNKKNNQKPPINSYMSTQNSPNKSKNFKKQQKSASISPYKGQISFYSSNQSKINIPKRNATLKQVYDIEKQNIYIQPHQKQSKTTKLSSQASSQNVSSKKYTNLSKNSQISKSKNNSITKKKHSKISNNIIAKFQV